MKMPFADGVVLRLAVQLDQQPERLPLEGLTTDIAGHDVRCLMLSAFEASAPLKIEQALRLAKNGQAV
jgi:hypothetical protein